MLPVAIKALRCNPREEQHVRAFCEEVRLLAEMSHPNVVQVHGLSVGQTAHLSLVMELASGGSLFDWLRSARRDPSVVRPTGSSMLGLLQGFARGMTHVHSRGVIHRDLKSANVLLNAARTTLKVCDFGLSREAFVTNAMSRVGSVSWASPEILLGLAYNGKTDVYSFGVVVWEMATGKLPFEGMDTAEIARSVAIDGRRLPLPAADPLACPPELRRLLAACFADASERPHFHEIEHSLDSCAETLTKALATPGGGE